MKLYNVEVDGIDRADFPHFVDAYISYAEHEDGTELSEEEYMMIDDDQTYEYVMAYLHHVGYFL